MSSCPVAHADGYATSGYDTPCSEPGTSAIELHDDDWDSEPEELYSNTRKVSIFVSAVRGEGADKLIGIDTRQPQLTRHRRARCGAIFDFCWCTHAC